MSIQAQPGLLAIDVGTSRVKLGWFPDETACDSDKPSQLPIAPPLLPEPQDTFACRYEHFGRSFAYQLHDYFEQFTNKAPTIVLASVNPELARNVELALKENGLSIKRQLKVDDLPMKIATKEPECVGIDRVLAALAVNRMRDAKRPAIIISMGTACTVNLISADGTFHGGAILPGLAMTASALHQGTASLPLVTPENLSLPANATGKNTIEAISAGVFWGTIGAIERIVIEQSRDLEGQPQLFLTGGDAELVVEALKSSGHSVWLMPHLVLSGIAIACGARP